MGNFFNAFKSLISSDDYDRETTNSDGSTYYGKDDGYGHTTWYNEDGEATDSTETPENDDYNQHSYHDEDYDPYYRQHQDEQADEEDGY